MGIFDPFLFRLIEKIKVQSCNKNVTKKHKKLYYESRLIIVDDFKTRELKSPRKFTTSLHVMNDEFDFFVFLHPIYFTIHLNTY